MTLNSTDTRVDHTTNAKYADNRAELRGTRGSHHEDQPVREHGFPRGVGHAGGRKGRPGEGGGGGGKGGGGRGDILTPLCVDNREWMALLEWLRA